jgi:hypothetical protein
LSVDQQDGVRVRCVYWHGLKLNAISGFLPIQSVYADIYARNEFWPDFRPEHFGDALAGIEIRTAHWRMTFRLIRHSAPEAERGEIEAGEVVGG